MSYKQVIVPQHELDRLEDIRMAVHELATEHNIPTATILNITNHLWRMSHSKYPVFQMDYPE